MQTKGQIARKYFEDGYNCSQSVLLAFAEDFGLDKKTSALISSSFGGGMGRLREVCGAVSGMFMVLGLKYGNDNPKAYEIKRELYKKVQKLAEEYKAENGSIICRELLGISKEGASLPVPEKRTDTYYKKRPCSQLVEYAADLVFEFIQNNP
ncbi:MAG: C-GCAxxG-C-C family protein [Ruminococcus sp.]